MQTEGVQAIAVVSLPMVLVLGWAVAAFLAAYGAWRRASRVLPWGVAALGLMTLLTPLAWYLYTVSHPESFSLGVADVMILAALAFVGGGVVASGLFMPSFRPSPAAKR